MSVKGFDSISLYCCELGYKTTTVTRIMEMRPLEDCPKPLTNDTYMKLVAND